MRRRYPTKEALLDNSGKPTKKARIERALLQNSTKTVEERLAVQQHAEKMSKCLNDSYPESKFSWLVHTIKYCIAQKEIEPKQHNIIFENNKQAAQANSDTLQRFNFDFEKFIESQDNTVLTPGSEFRSIHTLEKLLGNHQDWHKNKKIISKGCDISTKQTNFSEATKKMT